MICVSEKKSRAVKHRWQQLADNDRGVALIEFAMVLPVFAILYLGGYQLMEAVSVYRKVTTTTRSIADLSAQETSVTDTDLDTYLAASAQIMAPYATSRGTYRVSLIKVSAAGVATVGWSRSLNGTALTPGSDYALPASIKQNNISMIVADVRYTHHPIAFSSLLGDIPFNDQIFMIPRGNTTIRVES